MRLHFKADNQNKLLPFSVDHWQRVFLPYDKLMVTADSVVEAPSVFEHCERVAQRTGLGWELPSIETLQLIVDFTKYQPAADSRYFRFERGFFWSSTPTPWSDGHRFGIEFFTGEVRYRQITEQGMALSVLRDFRPPTGKARR